MEIKAFKGLHSVDDPLSVAAGALVVADNVVVTSTGALRARDGFSRVRAGALRGGYATRNMTRAYLVDGAAITTLAGVQVAMLSTTDPVYWTEVNDLVYFSNGVDSGILTQADVLLPWAWAVPPTPAPQVRATAASRGSPAGMLRAKCTRILPDGRETGPGPSAEIYVPADSEVTWEVVSAGVRLYVTERDGSTFRCVNTHTTLSEDFVDPLPSGCTVIEAWRGRIYAAQPMRGEGQTVVWFTQPLTYHLFNLNSNFIVVPGEVRALVPTEDALLLCTDSKIFSYSGDAIKEIAPYGVPCGQTWVVDQDRVLFWTLRGLCVAAPFTNLTERQVSVPPGVFAAGALIHRGGQKRYLVSMLQGGSAFNTFRSDV